MDRLSSASVDGSPNLPPSPPPTACNPSSAAGDHPSPDHESGPSAVRPSPPPQIDSTVSFCAAAPVPLSSPLHRRQHEQMSVPAAEGPAALNPSYKAADKSLRPAAVANSGAVVEKERLKKAFCLNSGSAAPAGCTATSLLSGSSTVVSGLSGAKSVATAVVPSTAQRLPLSPSRPLNCSGNNQHNRPINDVLNVSTARPKLVQATERTLPRSCLRDFRYPALQQKNPSSTPSVAASCASTAPSGAHETLAAVRAPVELSRSWQKNTAQVAVASQALLRLAPTSANVCHAVVMSAAAGAPQAPGATARPPTPSAAASVGSTVLRLPPPSHNVTVVNAPAAAAQRRTSSSAAAAVVAGPTAKASAAAATQEAAKVAAANILRGVVDTGFALTCLAHQAYRDALAGGTGRPSNQTLDQKQQTRYDGCRNNSRTSSGSRATAVEVTPASTAVGTTADSVVDKRLRLVWAFDENSRCVQRSALEVLASLLPQRYVCGYYSRFDNTRCSFRSESQLVLERHRRTSHVDAGGRLACARCGFTVRTPGQFHQHCIASHGDEGLHEAPVKTLCCPVCTYETAQPNRAKKHVERCVPAFDETKNLRPSEEALVSTRVTVRDCRPTIADVLAEAQIAAALSQTVSSASGIVHREVVVMPRPNIGIASAQHQPSIVIQPPGGGISVAFTMTGGQQLLVQPRGLTGASQAPRTSAAARPQPGLRGSVVAQGDRAVVATAAAVVPQQQQPIVRLTARPAVLLPPGNSTAASATATAAAIAALQQREAVTVLTQQPVTRLVVLSGQQAASATGSQQQQPAPSAAQQLVLRPPQLIAPAIARSTSHQVVAVGRSGEPRSSCPVQLQRAPSLRGAVMPTTQAQQLPLKKPVVMVTEAMVAESSKRTRTMPVPPPLRSPGRHQLSPPSLSRLPVLSSPTGRPSPLLAKGSRPPAAALLPTGRSTVALPRKGAAASSASRNLGRASAAKVHPVAADAKAKPGPSFSPNAAISRRPVVECPICHGFVDQCDLPVHTARRHPDGLEHDLHIKCDQCPQRFAEVEHLVLHLHATHFRHAPAGPRPQQNSCFICELPVNAEDLLIHIAVNHYRSIFKMFNVRKCESPQCKRDRIEYANEQQLSVHVLERHGMPTATLVSLVSAVIRILSLAELDPQFWERCEPCNLTFPVRAEFQQHLRRDHVMHPCEPCSIVYLNAESFQQHRLQYHAIGAPPQPCRICHLPVASKGLIDHCRDFHPQITRAYVRLTRLPYRQPATSEVVVGISTRAVNETPIHTVAMPTASGIAEAVRPARSNVAVKASEPVVSDVETPESTSYVIVEDFESDMSHFVDMSTTSSVAIVAPASATLQTAVDAPRSAAFVVANGAAASASWNPAIEASASATSHFLDARASGVALEAAAPATTSVAVQVVASPLSNLAVDTSAATTSDLVIEAPTFAALDVTVKAAASATSVVAVGALTDKDLQHATVEELNEDIEPPAKIMKF